MRQHEAAVGDRDRECGRGQPVRPGQHRCRGQPDDRPDRCPTEEHAEEFADRADDAQLPAEGHDQEDVVRDDRHAVVEQALALHQRQQAAGYAKLLEHRDHGGRVRGRDQHPEQQRGRQGEPEAGVHRQSDETGRDQQRDRGENQDRQQVAQELASRQAQHRGEHQHRQECQDQDVLEDLTGQGQIGAAGPEDHRPGGEPEHGQDDRERQVKSPRHHVQQDGDDQQPGDQQQ